MPILQDNRKTKEVQLKTIEGGKVTIHTSFTAADIEAITKEARQNNDTTIVLPLTLLIKDWNLTDENEQKLPIDKVNVGKLDVADITEIFKTVNLDNLDFLAQQPVPIEAGKN